MRVLLRQYGRPAGALLLLFLLTGRALAAGLPPPAGWQPGALAAAQRPALQAFFAQGVDDLDVFCAPDCASLQSRRDLFALFFRGSFQRVADKAEEDAAAAYAAQAAAYFTQPDYACRRPLTARVLEKLWQRPAAARACADTLPFLLDTEEGGRQLRQLPPARVAAVHLLFAGESGKTLSRFGHTSLRLVVCAPQRKKVDAACDEDLFEHIAVGFRAAVDNINISLWKGLSGGYALRLYADPFMKVYGTYTTDEFRSLASLPLQLSAPERELLVQALAEVHWAYRNDYRFFTQNCASELSWLLRVVSAVSAAEPAWLENANVRPDRLFAQAKASPAFAGAVLDDLETAERDGFYFPGSAPYYQLALDTLQQRMTSTTALAFAQFRELGAVQRRQQFYEPALAQPLSPARAAHAALVLEAWVERHLRRELLATLALYYLDITQSLLQETAYFDAAERDLLQRCLAGFRSADQQGQSGAGIPPAPVVPDTGCDLESAAFRSVLEKLQRVAPLAASHERRLAELQTTVATMNWLLPQTGLVSTAK
ncbi:MAG TPA: DUF4105 domain-containing protein [Moraxellaceae bacterium]